MKKYLIAAAFALLSCLPVHAQWQTPNHSVPVGRGAGVIGFGNVAPGTSGFPLLSQGGSTDPAYGKLANGGIATGGSDTVKGSIDGSTVSDLPLPNCPSQFLTYSTATHLFSCAGVSSAAPQGYLTPCQISVGSPVTGCTAGFISPTSDVTSVTNLYYEPAAGNQIPIWSGSAMVQTTFGELTLATPASRLANTLYDVCVFSNAGVVTPVFSVAWSASGAGAGSRGSGAGTAQITQTQGVWVNAVQISGVNGGSTFTIPASQCTIVATVFIDSVAGQVTFHRAYGQSRKWAVWNFYNQQPLYLKAGDATASWTYSTNTVRSSDAAAANSLTVVAGLPVPYNFEFTQKLQTQQNLTNNGSAQIGIGYNSVTVFSGKTGSAQPSGTNTNLMVQVSDAFAKFMTTATAPGIQTISALETAPNIGANSTFFGTEAFMLLTAAWQG